MCAALEEKALGVRAIECIIRIMITSFISVFHISPLPREVDQWWLARSQMKLFCKEAPGKSRVLAVNVRELLMLSSKVTAWRTRLSVPWISNTCSVNFYGSPE